MRFFFLCAGLLVGTLLTTAPAAGQTRHPTKPAAKAKTRAVRKTPRDPNAPPLYALPAPQTPPQPPLTGTLPLRRVVVTNTETGVKDTGVPDSVQATLRYVAPGQADGGDTWKLHDPDDRYYGPFDPNRHAHFRLDEVTPQGTVTRYYIINGLEPGTPAPWYHTTCATAYPPGHPGAPDKPRPGYLELEYHPACDVRLEVRQRPLTVTIRQLRANTQHRYQ